jgi:hypothetical protein
LRLSDKPLAGTIELGGSAKSGQNQIVSPTVLQSGPYRFFFFSSDRGEPIHVHVERERKTAKFWLDPVQMEYNHGFAPVELNKVATLVQEHETDLVKAWHEYFNPGN